MRKQRVTIREVAKLAGVSTGTVSRVLNGRPGVHPQTRARVLEVVRALGYVPNPVARELTGRGERTVGVLQLPGVPRLTPYFTLLYEYLADALWQEGFRLREVPTDPVGLPLEPAKGYILLGAHEHDPRLEYLQEHGQAFVLVGVYPGVFWVAPHDEEGGYLATRHLLELGHREILHLTGHLHNQAGRDRLAGYRRALEAYGVPFRSELVLDGEFSVLAAYRTLRRAWEGGLRFTAIFAASDEMAVGARAALEDLGLKVPQDVSLVGYDDLPEIGEGLTTVRQDIRRVAHTAVRLLGEAFEGRSPRGERVPVQLVVRQSTARKGVKP
ncbi:LacI family DNA-binding transcriptional regulator [Marinithermus hydrothermalis]|uniref:Transcriptional regulator, LacI family n=1 Tax=Marinithermus hydrothermalis (strain DSM 14884 / JCM 11576 / T1) TaxID=869210 RepID=F2NR93_MARHT|nr:LacI family DNA-binding transcriptional regulator [Marinithermus hydrothermalis]AEB12942.1 transcriptional regulator, LacI family [Marinithermus hydrothermalis DSM 14884]